MASSIYIGLISGTSMDAIDCALVDFNDSEPNQLDFVTTEIPVDLREKLLFLCDNHNGQIPLLGEADVEFARQMAIAVDHILEENRLKASQIAAIGSHGQTIRHHPPGQNISTPYTIQIGDPNTLAELTGITTIADFRRRDMAAGGQGAPIVPAFHREVFASADHDRIILNIGGMANITVLTKLGEISGFDTGPGNVLMDYWIQKKQGHPYDRNGSWASRGEPSKELLNALLSDPYFSQPPPKSTGRELFNGKWLEEKLDSMSEFVTPEDIQASLLELSVTSIRDAILDHFPSGEIIVCGGGVHNNLLMETLAASMPDFDVMPSDKLGVMADSVEAVAFAWLAHNTLSHRAVDFREITGSSHPVIAGGIYWATHH